MWTVTRNGPEPSNCGYATYTLGPGGCVPASHTLRDEGERPTGYAEAMAAPVVRRAPPTGPQRVISLANIDRKVTYFYPDRSIWIYIGNPMEIKANRKKVTDLWTVTRNGPDPSQWWSLKMYIRLS